jgi:PAS domain S-box-containing protein
MSNEGINGDERDSEINSDFGGAPTTRRLWRNQLELMLDSTGEGIYGIDMDGRCIFINRAGAELLGHEPDAVLGREMHGLIHHSHADGGHYPVADCPIVRAFRNGEPARIDCDVLWRADGTSFSAEYSSYPIIEDGLITGAVVTFTDISERKRAEELLLRAHEELERRVAERTLELNRTNERLRKLSAHAENVREAERTRIAREIHDELGSVLVALKMDVGWLARRMDGAPELQSKAASMARLIDSAVDNVGRIITDLRPSILDHQGLFAALEWYLQEFSEVTGLRVRWEAAIDADTQEPSDALATATYRMFQEILNNAARHANATALEVRVAAARHSLQLEVRDNGRGITMEQLWRPNAHGVLGMKERAQHFAGTFEIGPADGGGTLVRVHLPITEHTT